MMIRFANSEDDSLHIAKLIIGTDKIIPFLFGNSSKSLLKVKDLIDREGTVFSSKNILIFEDGNQTIKGILLSYSPLEIDKSKEYQGYNAVFSAFELVQLWFKSLLLKSIENKSEIDGIYIQNISVLESARGLGIGSKLLNHVEKMAFEQGYNSLWLDVAFNNLKAKKLYERHGFREVSNHKIFFSNNGFYRMKKLLKYN